MRSSHCLKLGVVLVSSLTLALIGLGCEQSAPAAPPQVINPVPPAPTSSPTYSPYIVGKNYQFVLYSTSFNVQDSISSVTTYDNLGNPVNAWTWVANGMNAPSQNMAAMTMTVLLTPTSPGGAPAKVQTKPNYKAGIFTTAGPPSSGTVVVTTTNGVVIPIPVFQVNVDPCDLN